MTKTVIQKHWMILSIKCCQDKQIRLLLEEMIGYSGYTEQTRCNHAFILLTGEGSNGKSTILNVIKKLNLEKRTTHHWI